MQPWIYQEKEYHLPEGADPKNIQGFVYLLTNKFNGKKYMHVYVVSYLLWQPTG